MFEKNFTAIGLTGNVVTMTAFLGSGVVQWTSGAPSVNIPIVNPSKLDVFKGTGLTNDMVLNMVTYEDNIFIHYKKKGTQEPQLYLIKASEKDKQSTRMPVKVNSNTKLMPVSNGGVALVDFGGLPSQLDVTYYTDSLNPVGPVAPYAVPNSLSMNGIVDKDLIVIDSDNVRFVTPGGIVPSKAPGSGNGDNTDPDRPAHSATALPSGEHQSSKSEIPVIIGGVVGGLALVVLVAFLVIRRKRKTRKGNTTSRSLFSKKQQDLFPPRADDSLVPLGLYNQERSLPPPPRDQDDDLERMGYNAYQRGHDTHMRSAEAPERAAFLSNHNHQRSSTQPSMDETIPSGKLFEEKIQLQVIRYEVPDAHLMAPHGTIGRLVLGTYHIISDPKSARSVKPQGGVNKQGLARSGTVVVRKNRGSVLSGRNSPLVEMAEESSMLLTDAENQHTFEGATLKWYMTEIHWKREAALLKRLKSPIFVMELLESYCIPALQNRAFTYPFVNAMGGRTSLLSDLNPVKTAQHTRAILRSISAAVEWCHRHGVVHLNIQPGSFFLEDDIDPRTEDASWKLWDFTCARYIGERIGPFGGGGETVTPSQYQPPANPTNPDSFPYMDQQQHDRQMDRIGGNPLPAAYTAPELLEAWRSGDINFPVEANMDTWSLGCLYYEILTGSPLFPSSAEAWGVVGGWEQNGLWASSKNFHVPYPPSPSAGGVAPATNDSETNSPYERSQTLDPSGSIAKLLRDMMAMQPEARVSLETIMERIY
ncbi:hypothetical protein BGZ95_000764 [Linnemannia exigua]|uniref:receptor protein-tyrosine kinase n=1 Tax=Linnemannia exigua TaxID=604196 RepID=A0AAD4H5F0_9FUNG|nr:hypothetical protein BGZ95_000764 [Linnemannia exigua]